MEKTLVMVKPDGVRRRLTGKIIERVEEEGFIIKGMKKLWMSKTLASSFYDVHKGKSFFSELLEFITSGPIVALLVEGAGCVERMRKIVGATDPLKAEKNTIRAIYGEDIQRNVVHASDSVESAKRELFLIFCQKEKKSIFEPIDIGGLKDEVELFFEEDPMNMLFMEEAEDIELASPLFVHVRLINRGKFIEAKGKVETTLLLSCIRCLECFEYPIKEEFLFHYYLLTSLPKELELKEEDFKIVYIKEKKIALFSQIREILLLSSPFNPLCKKDCKGLCQLCGKNLNKEQCFCKKEKGENPFSLLKK